MKAKALVLAFLFVFTFSPAFVMAEGPEGVPAIPAGAAPKPDDPGVAIAEYYRDCVVWVDTIMQVDLDGMSYSENQLADLGKFLIVHTSKGSFIFRGDAEALSFAHQLEEKGEFSDLTFGRYIGNGEIATGGSGFFCDAEGGFYTVAHVVKKKDDQIQGFMGPIRITSYEYWASLASRGRKYAVEAVGVDVNRDLAYMKVKDIAPADYKVAKMGDPKKLRVGDQVFTFGAPYALTDTLTKGVVSSLNRIIGLWYIEDFIQMDAPMNPGNSGSPLLNAAGEVVGLNDAGPRGADGIGFAVSTSLINADQLKKGDVQLPWFGVEAMLRNFTRVGSADNAGVPDIIRLYNDTGVLDSKSIQELLRRTYTAGFSDPNVSYAIVTEVEKTKMAGRVCPAMRPVSGLPLQRGDLITGIAYGSEKERVVIPIRNGMELRIAIVSMPMDQAFEIEYIRVEKGAITKNVTVLMLEKKSEEVKK